MSDPTIKEAQEAKKELQNEIHEKIHSFEEKYGVSVYNIDIIRSQTVGNPMGLEQLVIDLEL